MVNLEILNLYGSVINPYSIYLHWTTSSFPPNAVNKFYKIYITNETTGGTKVLTIPLGDILSFSFEDDLEEATTYSFIIISFNASSEASAPSNTLELSTGISYAATPGGNGGLRPFSMSPDFNDPTNRTRISTVDLSDLKGTYSTVLVTNASDTASSPSLAIPTTINIFTPAPFYQKYRLDKIRVMSSLCSPNNQYGYSTIRKFM